MKVENLINKIYMILSKCIFLHLNEFLVGSAPHFYFVSRSFLFEFWFHMNFQDSLEKYVNSNFKQVRTSTFPIPSDSSVHIYSQPQLL
jgi:hypothetical protein